MEIPKDINYLLDEIDKSHDIWKAFYWGIWNRDAILQKEYQGKDWEKETKKLKLPASGEKPRVYTINKLHLIFTQSDLRMAYNHLLWVHILIEHLAKKLNEMNNIKKVNGKLVYTNNLADFLVLNGLITKKQRKHFIFSRHTRNQIVHGYDKNDKDSKNHRDTWLIERKKLRAYSKLNKNGTIHLDIKDCERWQKIFEKIGREVRKLYIEGERNESYS